jgi:hypothetical protein
MRVSRIVSSRRGRLTAPLGITVIALGAGGFVACSAGGAKDPPPGGLGADSGLDGSWLDASGIGGCGSCVGTIYTSCVDGVETTTNCPAGCTPNVGCTPCSPSGTICVANAVHKCTGDGMTGELVQNCDPEKGEICNNGTCRKGCDLSKEQPSNLGCEFYAVDLDLSDGISDPANGPFGVVLANAGTIPAKVVIEQNDAPVGTPIKTKVVFEATVNSNDLKEVKLGVREVDCAPKPGSWTSPGTCLSSNAFRITSTAPIVVYQFNTLGHAYSTDASLLMPTTALGQKYRVTGWPVSHSYPAPGAFVQRAYVTIVGTQPGTTVSVKPKWRIKGNPPIAATPAGGEIKVTLGPFDVLNLETDDATLSECIAMTKPPYCADLTGTSVEASAPVAVFSGTEESGVGIPEGGPKPPSWSNMSSGCCNQHLEEQLFPVESFGRKFLITRSPIRSNPEFTSWKEPDVLRFVGAAAEATVTTNLPAPMDKFTLKPGEVRDTWSQTDIVVTSTQPIVVAQFLVGQGYVEPQPKGDPSFTIFPPVEQARTEYVFLSPAGWKEDYVVIGTEKGNTITLDGAEASCPTFDAGTIDGKSYEARRCKISGGVHRMSGKSRFQIMAYGYADADTYSFAGGSDIKKIYVPPPLH